MACFCMGKAKNCTCNGRCRCECKCPPKTLSDVNDDVYEFEDLVGLDEPDLTKE